MTTDLRLWIEVASFVSPERGNRIYYGYSFQLHVNFFILAGNKFTLSVARSKSSVILLVTVKNGPVTSQYTFAFKFTSIQACSVCFFLRQELIHRMFGD